MGFTAASSSCCLVILLLAVATADNTPSATSSVTPQDIPDQTTVNGELKPSESTVKSAQADNKLTKVENVGKNDDNDVAPDGDVAMDELLLFESLIADGADAFDRGINPEINKDNIKPSNINRDSNNQLNSRETTKPVGIRRQGDVNPSFRQEKTSISSESNDSTQETTSDPPPRFGQRSRNLKPKVQDDAPVLKLTQGGYDRPFRQPRFRNRYVSKPDSSEQTEKIVQEPARNPNRQQATRRIVPQVAYTSPRQPPYNTFGAGAVLNPAFEAPARNVLTRNHNVPTTVQNGFLNTPPTGFTDYPTLPYAVSPQFPSNDAGVFPNFGRDPANVALFQGPQDNPFQDARMLFQGASQGQTQPVLMDPTRDVAPQFQPNAFSPFTNFDNIGDNSRPDYASYFRSPTVNPQFQVPPNFYGTNPSGPQTFSNPPISFLSNPLNPNERYATNFLRYPVTARDAQQNQRNANDQQPESDASQENKETSVNSPDAGQANNNDQSSVPFGARLPDQSEADVFIRYPTSEAGYAVEENLPPRNGSEEAKSNRQSTPSEERNVDPYRNALNTLRTNQRRRNNSFEYPPQFFRDVPVDFGYQRPQNPILVQNPDRNVGLQRFPSPEFRSPFDPAPSPENNYLFLNADTRRRSNQDSDRTPSCAKQNNASICFEDNEYPRNDILYSLNTNSFIADRLSGPDLPLDSTAFVVQNMSRSDEASTENYACTVDTKFGSPLRAKNLAGAWRIIVSLPGRFSQPVRLEVCRSLGDACNYANSQIKTTCVQKFSLQRLLSWSPERGIYSDVYKFPIACSCQILEKVEA